MTSAKMVRDLSTEDAAYIAGLIDGEGSISLTRKHVRENRQLVVTISNTERPILEFVLQTVGAGKITSKRTSRAHHRPGLTFAISNRQALSLLAQVHPFLRSYKRARSALVLSSYVALTPRNGRYNSQLAAARASFEERFLTISNRIRENVCRYSVDANPFSHADHLVENSFPRF